MLRSVVNAFKLRSFQANYNAAKLFSADHPKAPSSGESSIVEILKQRFPKAQYIEVQDISGGCGAMYEIVVETSEFKGLNTVKQHRLITEALKSEIKDMHGIRIHTKLPSDAQDS